MSQSRAPQKVSLQYIIGKGYADFWNFKGRYRVCKGSRASKKSTTAALNIVKRTMQYPLANTLVIRKTASTLKDSCWTQLKWAINKLQVGQFWKARQNPLELEYLPTGQKILFRGLDDPLKITSITVDVGTLCWGWIEEAYEINDEEDFNRLDESLRGELPEGYFIQWTITLNPWDRNHWIKARFFDRPNANVLAKSTNYLCNEFLSATDLAMFEDMKKNDPERYKVAGLGEWGIAEGQFFDCWRSDSHVVRPFAIPDGWMRFRSMDWGSYHPYCVQWFAID
jgi:phage terminase large subunit